MSNELISSIRDDFYNRLSGCNDLHELNELRIAFLGRNGAIAVQMQKMAGLSHEDKKGFGKAINELKEMVSGRLTAKHLVFEKEELARKLKVEEIDISLPSRHSSLGKQHLINKVIDDLIDIFAILGFQYVDGPEIESDWHNFTALNIPPTHPARQSHDTFYLDEHTGASTGVNGTTDNHNASDSKIGGKLVLRTHTSNVQKRHMLKTKPPHYIISIGRVYRSDYDQTHAPMFHQIECLCIDKDVSMANMKWCIQTFLQMFFEIDNLPLRFRSSYFPFTEPSAEVDMQCDRSNKSNIKLGTGNDWLEILGCGMVHRNVLQNVGLSIDEYRGFAFGCGIERLAMLKYNISDLRNFFEGDLRWLRYYGQ